MQTETIVVQKIEQNHTEMLCNEQVLQKYTRKTRALTCILDVEFLKTSIKVEV
jgi:hypothetical protein